MTSIIGVNSYANSTSYFAPASKKAAPDNKEAQINALRQANTTGNTAQRTGGYAPINPFLSLIGTGPAKSTADMTMDEYKVYIREKLAHIPRHPSQANDSVAYNISEAGFEAMKSDPEYEKSVFDGLAKSFAVHNPWTSMTGGCYNVINIGATKEQSSAQSWYPGYQNGKGKELYDKESQKSFWADHDERHEQSMQRAAERAYMRHLTERLFEL